MTPSPILSLTDLTVFRGAAKILDSDAGTLMELVGSFRISQAQARAPAPERRANRASAA